MFMVVYDKGYVLGGVGSWLLLDEDVGFGMVIYDFRFKVVDNGIGFVIGILGKLVILIGVNFLFMLGYNMLNGFGLVFGGYVFVIFDGIVKVEELYLLDLYNLIFFDLVINE